MNSLNKEILNFIKKVARKIKLNFVINIGLVGLKYLLSLIYLLIVVSLFIVIKDREILISITGLVGIVIILVYGIIKGPNKKKVALILDSKGLDERLSTALEFIEEKDAISLAQREDTVNHIRKFDLKKIRIKIDKRELLKTFAIFLVCMLTMTVKTDATIRADKLKLFEVYKEETIKNFEKEILDIEKNENISTEEKEALKKILEDAKKDIIEALDKEELNKALERTELKLKEKEEAAKDDKEKSEIKSLKDRLFEKYNNEKKESAKIDLNNLMNELLKEENGKELANAILSEDEKELEEALAKLRENVKNMTPDELNELSKSLKKASEKAEGTELKEALENASKDVLKGELDAGELKDAIKKTQEAANQGESQNEGEEEGQGQGSGENEGEGQGQGGQSNGEGQDGSGQGVGPNEGSDEGEEGEGEETSGLEIFIPGRDLGNDENLQGNIDENGQSQIIENENGMNLGGTKVEYEKVVGDYTNSALESINNSNIPEGLKNIIKDYFNGLN